MNIVMEAQIAKNFLYTKYKCYMETKKGLDLECHMKKNGYSWKFITNLPSFIGSYKFCVKPNFQGLYKNIWIMCYG
jgi:hypothetical protein